jgi:oxygen-independent coproporphyrinogen-3 oxidase
VGESRDDWRASLAGAVALGVDHVSAYALTVEPGTPLGRAVAAGTAVAPDDDDQAEKYALADDALAAAGLEWYEISNWARPGQECRHNLLYWNEGEYLGIGCAAHGHTDGTRWWNVRTPERYIDAIAPGASAIAGKERLDDATRAEEAFSLALRTRAGVPRGAAPAAAVALLVEDGLLDSVGDRIVLTRRGRLLASDVTARLLLAAATRAGTR